MGSKGGGTTSRRGSEKVGSAAKDTGGESGIGEESSSRSSEASTGSIFEGPSNQDDARSASDDEEEEASGRNNSGNTNFSKGRRRSRKQDGIVDVDQDYKDDFLEENMTVYFEEEEETHKPPQLLAPMDSLLFHTDIDDMKNTYIPASAWGGDILKELDARLFVQSTDALNDGSMGGGARGSFHDLFKSQESLALMLDSIQGSAGDLRVEPDNGLDTKTFQTLMQFMKRVPSSSNIITSNDEDSRNKHPSELSNKQNPNEQQRQQDNATGEQGTPQLPSGNTQSLPSITLTTDSEEKNSNNGKFMALPSAKQHHSASAQNLKGSVTIPLTQPSISIVFTSADGEESMPQCQTPQLSEGGDGESGAFLCFQLKTTTFSMGVINLMKFADTDGYQAPSKTLRSTPSRLSQIFSSPGFSTDPLQLQRLKQISSTSLNTLNDEKSIQYQMNEEDKVDLLMLANREDALTDELVQKKNMVLQARSDMLFVKEETDVYWNQVLKVKAVFLFGPVLLFAV
jgi:hypothetical protein